MSANFTTPMCKHGNDWNTCTECRPALKTILEPSKDKNQGFIPTRPWSPCIGPNCQHSSHNQ